MKRKVLLLFTLVALSELLFSCWKYDDDCIVANYYENIIGISSDIIQVRDTITCYEQTTSDSIICRNTKIINLQEDSAIIKNQEFHIKLQLGIQAVSISEPTFSIFTPAYACPPSTSIGLETPISRLEVRCNQEILGIKSGELINDKLSFINDIYSDEKLSTDEWLSKVNATDNSFYIGQPYLKFNEPINSSEFLTFEITITLENGEKFSTTTNAIKVID
ncbi:MAG: hypothetical protein GY827_11200 [Cytophagales bacterium]|nr:hypothetical protein [Cytophagales bacterium]